MTDSPTPDTLYFATARPFADKPPLEGDIEADVCIIGGGLAGVSTALELAERGVQACLIEQHRIGFGASGRNGGHVVQGFTCDMSRIEKDLGAEDTHKMWDLGLEAVDMVKSRVAELEIDCSLRWGYLHAALNAKQYRELEDMVREWSGQYKFPHLELLGRDEMKRHIGSDAYYGAVYDTGSGHIHPLNYLYGLADRSEALGAKLFENSAALDVETNGDAVTVRTAKGTVRAKHLVYCGNAYLGKLSKALNAKIAPVASYVAATEPLDDDTAKRLLPTNAAVADSNSALNYFRLSEDNRLVFGGGANYAAQDPRNLEGFLRRNMGEVYPELKDITFDYIWSGLIGITVSRIPGIGRLADNVYFGHGFSGHGVAHTGLAGRLIAEGICGKTERLELFEKIRQMPFPGGIFRTPALVAGMSWYKLKDRLGI